MNLSSRGRTKVNMTLQCTPGAKELIREERPIIKGSYKEFYYYRSATYFKTLLSICNGVFLRIWLTAFTRYFHKSSIIDVGRVPKLPLILTWNIFYADLQNSLKWGLSFLLLVFIKIPYKVWTSTMSRIKNAKKSASFFIEFHISS